MATCSPGSIFRLISSRMVCPEAETLTLSNSMAIAPAGSRDLSPLATEAGDVLLSDSEADGLSSRAPIGSSRRRVTLRYVGYWRATCAISSPKPGRLSAQYTSSSDPPVSPVRLTWLSISQAAKPKPVSPCNASTQTTRRCTANDARAHSTSKLSCSRRNARSAPWVRTGTRPSSASR